MAIDILQKFYDAAKHANVDKLLQEQQVPQVHTPSWS